MGHGGQVRLGIYLAASAFATSAFAQDASRTLQQARDKLLLKADHLPTYACVETINRSYFLRTNTPDPPPSCERIAIDRQKGRSKLKLDSTDRLRVAVTIAGDREIYSWTGRTPVTYSVEDILRPGLIGTGGFAAFLLDVFRNPSVEFRPLSERAGAIGYGFRVPVDSSHYSVGAGRGWVATGYSGEFYLSPESQEIKRFTLESDELPRETSMCQTSSKLEFGNGEAGADWLTPVRSTLRDVMQDASETEAVTTISDCRHDASKPAAPSAPKGAPLRPGIVVTMIFDRALDTETSAAGDEISAIIDEAHLKEEESGDMPPLKGATVTGRIVRVQHWTARERRPAFFLFALAFETVEINGVTSPFYAKLVGRRAGSKFKPLERIVDPLSLRGMRNWPGLLIIEDPAPRYVVEAPFYSVWLTTAAGLVK
jgi:hypothetical protein